MPAADLRDQAGRLGVRVLEPHDLDPVTARLLGVERLAEPGGIPRDHRIGGVQDVSGRAEVLLEPHLDGMGKIAAETPDVADIGAAPGIDRLVVVADHEHLPVPASQQPQPGVLGVVHVLVFVGEHAVEPAGPARPVVRVGLHGARRPQQEIAEIRGVAVAQGGNRDEVVSAAGSVREPQEVIGPRLVKFTPLSRVTG